MDTPEEQIIQRLSTKSVMKQLIYKNTCDTFKLLKKTAKEITDDVRKKMLLINKNIIVELSDKEEFQTDLKFAGDLLMITMHTNIFEFPKSHEIMKTPYITDDSERSYCGIIFFYNFLADSFKYSRINDAGYLVARLFINKEMHYMVEGKRQVGFFYNSFSTEPINKEVLKRILSSAVNYCIDFDLLTPPYDTVKEVTVQEIQDSNTCMNIKTGKRLGFRFQADHDKIIS
jgi:hypothetical protein